MPLTLKVVTLNCWGVTVPPALGNDSERLAALCDALASSVYDLVLLQEVRTCSDRHERITAIAKVLAEADYDIVLLEEIWTQSDYEKITAKVQSTFPHTHYFHSGMFGSGVCIFSKHPIQETSLHRFPLNGYAHRLDHGDWFCGKAVGFAKFEIQGFRIHVYGTHLHAQYSEDHDDYIAHRVAQSCEMSQYIKMTSVGCDAVIAGGDFNLQPKDLGYKMLICNANLKDAYLTQEAEPEEDEHGSTTCDRPDNIYHSVPWVARNPHGLRLDYLLYRANEGCEMKCEKSWLTFRKVPGRNFPYSDHEGLAATFVLKKNESAPAPKRDSAAIEEHFMEALPVLTNGMKRVRANQVFQAITVVICMILLAFLSDVDLPYGFNIFVWLLRFLITLGMGYVAWMAVVMSNFEINALTATKKDINNLLRCNPNNG